MGLCWWDRLEKRLCTYSTLPSRKEKIHNYINNNMLLTDAPRGPHKDWITDEHKDFKIPECLKAQREG